jgi:protoporphyrinogen/coproporphyrinogen III oxidase
MLGKLIKPKEPITIVGGGFSGLLFAWRMVNLGYEVDLYEKEARLGGIISTKTLDCGFSEAAANSLLVNLAVAELIESLKLELVRLKPEAKARYIVRDKKMHRWPLTIKELLSLIYHLTAVKAPSEPIETVADWANTFLGPKTLDYLIDPALTGIYAAKPDILALEAVMPRFKVASGQTLLSVIIKNFLESRQNKKKLRPFMAIPRGGMEQLTISLENWLRNSNKAKIHLNQELTTLPSAQNRVLTIPAREASNLIANECRESAEILAAIEYAPLVSITVVIENKLLTKIPKGTGCLFPACEKHDILGILFCSSSFEGVTFTPNHSVLRIMLGGVRRPEVVVQEETELLSITFNELNQLFHLKVSINIFLELALNSENREIDVDIVRWPKAIPIYSPKMWREIQKINWTTKDGNILFSNYTGKISIRGMVENVLAIDF